MILKDFYHIVSIEKSECTINAVIEINASHPVFKGHFPGQPVVPGVCMMQVVKEITEQVLQYETELEAAYEMKFLSVIDPTKDNIIYAIVKHNRNENGKIEITASLFKDEVVYFKFKGLLR